MKLTGHSSEATCWTTATVVPDSDGMDSEVLQRGTADVPARLQQLRDARKLLQAQTQVRTAIGGPRKRQAASGQQATRWIKAGIRGLCPLRARALPSKGRSLVRAFSSVSRTLLRASQNFFYSTVSVPKAETSVRSAAQRGLDCR